MESHGIEWEHKDTHEKHLSVLDYKKQERAAELEQLGAKIEEKQAQQLFLRLVKKLAEKENVGEELKATDMMLWVQKMNNIRILATEVVNAELIYTV